MALFSNRSAYTLQSVHKEKGRYWDIMEDEWMDKSTSQALKNWIIITFISSYVIVLVVALMHEWNVGDIICD